jgi:nitrogen fixation protein FixH
MRQESGKHEEEGLAGRGGGRIFANLLGEKQVVTGRLTGRQVLAWICGFFFAIFVANGALIYFALHTLHGSELENPYDASQAYNKRIAEARAQDERGWTADVTTRAEGSGERVMVEFRDRKGAPVSDLEVTARFEHPFDAAKDRQTTLASDGVAYEGVATPVAPGRWTLVIEASRGAKHLFRSENKLAVADTVSN